MNRMFSKIAFVLLASVMTTAQLHAQFTTTFAKNATPGQQSGFYYSLPQTMLQLDFIVEETDCEPGPLSNFASLYFNMEEVVEYSTKEYNLLDVRMKAVSTPDPNATFFVTVASGRGASKAEFDVLPNGIIKSVGAGNVAETEPQPAPLAPIVPTACPPVTSRQGFVSLMTQGKSDAQLAREAADKIAEIRKAKFDILGF